jgi:hypothetical protein
MPKRTHIPKAATISGPSYCACGCQSISIIPCDARGEPSAKFSSGSRTGRKFSKKCRRSRRRKC